MAKKITKKYAKRLIKQGKARIAATLRPDNKGIVWVAIDRLDLQRVDHYID